MFIEIAHAQAAVGEVAKPSMWEQMFPLVFMFIVLYFLLIRPQGKKQRQQTEFLQKLKVGDKVITNAGILGTVEGLTDRFVTLEISDGVKIKMLKNQVAGPFAAEAR